MWKFQINIMFEAKGLIKNVDGTLKRILSGETYYTDDY